MDNNIGDESINKIVEALKVRVKSDMLEEFYTLLKVISKEISLIDFHLLK